MTVGIAAICENESEPEVIVAADRMVTVGRSGGVEYEDTSTKIETLVNDRDISAVVIGSGNTTYIDEIVNIAKDLASANQIKTPDTARELVVTAYKHAVQKTISNSVLSPLGFEIEDLRNNDVSVPPEIQRAVFEQGQNIKQQAGKEAQLLVVAASKSDSRISVVAGNDYTDFSEIGYAVIGSGTDSARLTFIRKNYDSGCSFQEAVFTVVEAKSQAEERQGVGQQMDILKVSQSEIQQFTDAEINELRTELTNIKDAEREAREKVINSWSKD